MPHLSFAPLARNRYRVRGTGKKKDPIIKKAQLGNFERAFYGNLRNVATQHATRVEHGLLEVRISNGYANCPYCGRGTHIERRIVKCGHCHTRFVAI